MPSIDPAQLNPIASEERDIADADLAQCLLDLREGFAKFVKQTGDARQDREGARVRQLSPGTRGPSRGSGLVEQVECSRRSSPQMDRAAINDHLSIGESVPLPRLQRLIVNCGG